MKEIDYTCEKCGFKYKENIYNEVNIMDNPELRDDVLTGMIFMHNCPNCNNKTFIPQSMIYSDFKNGFMSYLGDLYDCYKNYDAFINISDLALEDNTPKLNYSFSTNLLDFKTNIIASENHIDTRYLRIFFVILRHNLLKVYKDDIEEIRSMSLDYSSDNKLLINLEIKENDLRTIPFNFEYYNDLLPEITRIMEGNNALMLDLDLAQNIILNKNGYCYIDNNIYHVGLIEHNGIIEEVYIPELLKDYCEAGDDVVVYSEDSLYNAVILNVREGHLLDFSLELLGYPTVIGKRELKAVRKVDIKIDNSPLVDALKLYKEKKDIDYRPDDLMFNTFVFAEIENDILKDDDGYVRIYASNDDGLKIASSLDDVIRIVTMDPKSYKGILFVDANLKMEAHELLDYRSSIYFSYNERMSSFIDMITDLEKAYLGDVYLDIIYSIDGRISKEEVINKHNLDLDNYNYLCNVAIRKIRNIILINY